MKFIIQPLNCSMEEALEVVKYVIDKKGSKFTFLDKSLITYNIQRRVNKNSISYKISKVPFSFMVFPEEDRWVIYNTITNSHIKVFNSKEKAWKEARRLARGSGGKAVLKDKDTITTDYRSEPTRKFEELLDEYLKKSPEELEKIGKDLLKAGKDYR